MNKKINYKRTIFNRYFKEPQGNHHTLQWIFSPNDGVAYTNENGHTEVSSLELGFRRDGDDHHGRQFPVTPDEVWSTMHHLEATYFGPRHCRKGSFQRFMFSTTRYWRLKVEESSKNRCTILCARKAENRFSCLGISCVSCLHAPQQPATCYWIRFGAAHVSQKSTSKNPPVESSTLKWSNLRES